MRAEVCLITDVLTPELTFWLVGTITSQVDSPRGDLSDDSRLATLSRATPHQPQEQHPKSRTPSRPLTGMGRSGGSSEGMHSRHGSSSRPYDHPPPEERRTRRSSRPRPRLETPDPPTQPTSPPSPTTNPTVWHHFLDNDVLIYP